MKVIISIDQIKPPLTGVGRYSYELVKALRNLPQIESLRYFRGTGFDTDLVRVQGQAGRLTGFGRRLLAAPGAIDLYRKITAFRQTRVLRNFEDHLFHGTSFYLPPFPGRSVVTIHDLSPFVWPECHPPERVRYMEVEVGRSVERASLLITVSEFTREQVAKYFGKPLDEIRAVPLASASSFFPREKKQLEACLNKHGLAYQRYSLFVGTIEPRKNLLVLLDAYERLPARLRNQWPLVLTGYRGWRSEGIHARIAQGVRAGWVKYLGFVDGEDLPLLYAGAWLFVFPSLYEGFGLPVLEAMSSGIPVVCSRSSSLPEVAEGVALMCEANDVDALTESIKRALEDDSWRVKAILAGLVKSRNYSWPRCAQATADIYVSALRKSGS
ncbi:glycosyltransferase family 4 protein [Methyloversatilis thermotolerans]|uniref:glycosyltransferase family 4 protein n=1 Tax=Methyloversatilis thermotolerans TaxID=1346290 RepID=UPI000981E733|nr:glycosyltransferase family 1 protein [Methyloversatilis thermotolerans]